MKKSYIILTVFITHPLYGPPPPPPPPSGYQNMQVSTQPKMLIPPQLENPQTIQQSVPHPSPSSTPGAMTALLKDPQVPMGPKIRALQGPASGLALSGKTYKVRPGENSKVPQTVHALTNGAMASWTQNHRVPVTTGQLFDNPELGQAYQNFIDAVHEVPTFLPMFRKLHIVALHQIYLHLVGIYITLNMTSITDIKSYLALERRWGLNKKTLIINQLVKIIQSQLTQALMSLLPGIPVSYCIKSGMTALHRDTLSNPDSLVLDLETSVLTAIGAAPVSNDDAIELYSALTAPRSKDLIKRNRDINIDALEQGLKIIYQGAGFVTPLSKNQRAAQAVVAAINTIIGDQAQKTSNNNYQQIIQAIESGSTNRITEQQMKMFQQIIKQMVYGVPLAQEIAAETELGRMLEKNDPQPLSPAALNALAGVLGFILQNYEQQTSTMLHSIVKKLGELNPEMQTLSPMQKLQLQQLSIKLNPPQGQTPQPLDAISTEDRTALGIGLITLGSSRNSTFSRLEKNILIGIGNELQKAPVALADLNRIQVITIKKAFTIFSTYQFEPLNKEQMLSQFSKEQLEELSMLCGDVNSQEFKKFEQFSKEQQLLLLRMYQGLLAVVQTRLHEHQEASQTLKTIFASNSELQTALFQSLTSNQYLALNNIDQFLQEKGNQFSFAMLPNETPRPQPGDSKNNPPISARAALGELFSIDKNAARPSLLTMLLVLQKQNSSNPVLKDIMGRMPGNEEQQYQAIAQNLSSPQFNFSDFNITQKRMLVRDFQELQQAGTSQSIEYIGQRTLLAGTSSARIQTLGVLIESTMNFSNTKTSFLWVLKQYLIFFNRYCATLQEYQSNGYAGLTQFEEYAQKVTEKLRGTEIQKLNPSIFFYNKETLGGIRMLPQLAQLVENTEIVPYPTFPILLATQGSTVDPLDGKTYNNIVNYGNFSFNKFFFIDTEQPSPFAPNADPQAYQPAQELTGQAADSIRWVKKVDIPASTKLSSYVVENEQGEQENVRVKSYDSAYVPDNVPPGISGFYANIPIFAKNPVDPRKSLIRLYEQPIYAQPAWLNSPGFSSKKPDNIPGVITVLRGCLGDFTSLLGLDIFDPCLNVIFASALALPDRATSFHEVQSIPEIQQAMRKCSLYLKSKRAELLRMSQMHQVNSSAISGPTNTGGGGSLHVRSRPQQQLLPQNLSTALAAGGVAL